MKKKSIIFLASIFCLLTIVSVQASFPDVAQSHPNYDAIEFVQKEGIVNGFSDGEFKPDIPITRAEIMNILISSNYPHEEIENCTQPSFPDITEDNSHKNYLCLGKSKDIIDGYTDGNFYPSKNITNAEASKVIVNIFGLEQVGEPTTEDKFKPYVMALIEKNALPESITNLQHEIKRGQVAEIVYRILANIKDKSTANYDNIEKSLPLSDPTPEPTPTPIQPTEKVKVELFVMSLCPFGVQMEKAIIPAVETLGNNVDFKIKFVDYVMHGVDEVGHNMLQYCIQRDYPDQFLAYMRCFLEDGNKGICFDQISIEQIHQCGDEIDEEYKIGENYLDQSTWVGNYPPFNLHKADCEKYGIQGSPTLVINEKVVNVNRTPQDLLNAICNEFENKPAECNQALSTEVPSAGFGWDTSSENEGGVCY